MGVQMNDRELKIEVRPMLARLQERGLFDDLLAICRRRHVLMEEVLIGKHLRTKAVVAARDEFCSYLRDRGLSLTEIGRLVGLNHSTCTYSIRRHKEREASDGKADP